MVARNSICLTLGLVLAASMVSMTHSSDPSSLDSFGNSEVKNDDITANKRPAFFIGSRYGRSPQYYETKARRFSIAPRNDRFFLGSRYGKRTGELASPAFEQTSLDKLNTPFMMSCIYTGIKNFYRCSNTDEINDVINQLTADQNETDK